MIHARKFFWAENDPVQRSYACEAHATFVNRTPLPPAPWFLFVGYQSVHHCTKDDTKILHCCNYLNNHPTEILSHNHYRPTSALTLSIRIEWESWIPANVISFNLQGDHNSNPRSKCLECHPLCVHTRSVIKPNSSWLELSSKNSWTLVTCIFINYLHI